MSKNEQDSEASSYPDGLREGVMSDSIGVHYDIGLDEDELTGPAQVEAY